MLSGFKKLLGLYGLGYEKNKALEYCFCFELYEISLKKITVSNYS